MLLDSAELGTLTEAVAHRIAALADAHVPARLWARDPTVWGGNARTPELADRLGWLDLPGAMAAEAAHLAAFAAEARGFTRVVVCGMGGSSLAPEMFAATFAAAPGAPQLVVLDSTDPRAVRAAVPSARPHNALFLISSKSGTTIEPDSFFRYFWQQTEGQGSHFVAITDPGTPLMHLAEQHRFRRVFLAPPDVGGRYSALTVFGLVPAALLGLDLPRLLGRAQRMADECGPDVPAAENPGLVLGATLGEAARSGRNKATFVLSPHIATFGLWLEQLIAESTGKNGKGILPVAGERLGDPSVYGTDRLFVAIGLAGEEDEQIEQQLTALVAAGHPVLRLTLADRYDLGAEFFRWEFATAVAGAVLGLNPFDQPNVAESKANTQEMLQRGANPSPPASPADLERFWTGLRAGDYVALMAYGAPNPETDARLDAIRVRIRDRFRVATTVGYGPRFLHSTGQFHKGGPPVGHFLQITERSADDLPIPGQPFTFAALEAAQAEGDLVALRKRSRPALRLDGFTLLEE